MRAFIFPGQGSQYVKMGEDLCDIFDLCRTTFQEADDALGFSLSRLCFSGPEDELCMTEHTQPAILTVSVAILRLLEKEGIRPDYVAGHSLGEYSALVAADAIDFQDAVRIVRNRGKYMQEAVPIGAGAMAAIIGLQAKDVEAVCRECEMGEVVSAANYNSPGQTVIAGHSEAVKRAASLAQARGARKAIMLPVSAPFHCALMKPAAEKLRKDLEKMPVRDLKIPLITNVDAGSIHTADQVLTSLYRQVCSPVKWEQSVREMVRLGVDSFVEVGPGKALSGMVRRITGEVHISNVEDVNAVHTFLTAMKHKA